jgi:hypothetical protein
MYTIYKYTRHPLFTGTLGVSFTISQLDGCHSAGVTAVSPVTKHDIPINGGFPPESTGLV